MTKRAEIEILRNAITALGTDSYLGPWLASVVAEVEAQIRSDYFPTNTMVESTEKARLVIEGATLGAVKIIADATATAVKVTDRAELYRDNVLAALRHSIRNLSDV